jgi:hypothetical protein
MNSHIVDNRNHDCMAERAMGARRPHFLTMVGSGDLARLGGQGRARPLAPSVLEILLKRTVGRDRPTRPVLEGTIA